MTDSTLEIASSMGEVQNKVTLLSDQARTLSNAASRAISFTRKNWVDTQSSGTPITAADLNRIEQAIVDLNRSIDDLQDSVSRTGYSITPNENLSNYNAYVNSGYKHSDMVTLQAAIILSEPTFFQSDTLRLFSLPSGCRPSATRTLSRMCLCICGTMGENCKTRGLEITTSGSVNFKNLADGTADVMVFLIPGVTFAL